MIIRIGLECCSMNFVGKETKTSERVGSLIGFRPLGSMNLCCRIKRTDKQTKMKKI